MAESMTNAAIALAGLSSVLAGLIAIISGSSFWLALLIYAAVMSSSCLILLIILIFRKPDYERISHEIEIDLMALEEVQRPEGAEGRKDQSRG